MSALRAEYKFHPISGWISRHKELQRGVSCMDIDLFYENHIRGFCFHLEFKYRGEQFSEAQRSNIAMIADVWSKASAVRHFSQYTTKHDYLGYFVVMIEGDRVSNEDGVDVVKVSAYGEKVKEWSFEEGAEDVLLKICNGQLL